MKLYIAYISGQDIKPLLSAIQHYAHLAEVSICTYAPSPYSYNGDSAYIMIKLDEGNYPLFAAGTADVLVATDPLEMQRGLSYLKPDGRVVIIDAPLLPMCVKLGTKQYPAGLVDRVAVKYPVWATNEQNLVAVCLRAIGVGKDLAMTVLGTDVDEAYSLPDYQRVKEE